LEASVAAYRSALEELTRDRAPLDWARVQANLGNVLRKLSECDGGTARLKEAIAAYREALEEGTRGRVPREWAGIQNSLGIALAMLGEREGKIAYLEEAVAAFRSGLGETSNDRAGMTRNLDRALAFVAKGKE
jgi:tetratricopeptide (TPR) repeat protein